MTWLVATITCMALAGWLLLVVAGARPEWHEWTLRVGRRPLLQFASYSGTLGICLGLACGIFSRDTVPPAIENELDTAAQESP